MSKRPKRFTHDELVRVALRVLRTRYRCGVYVPELSTWCPEIPDAIGWKDSGQTTVVIECKTNRADFLRDRRKWHRAGRGLGHLRAYLAPEGVIHENELPKGWSLFEARSTARTQCRRIVYSEFRHEVNEAWERGMMYSLLRRCEIRGHIQTCLSAKWRRRENGGADEREPDGCIQRPGDLLGLDSALGEGAENPVQARESGGPGPLRQGDETPEE